MIIYWAEEDVRINDSEKAHYCQDLGLISPMFLCTAFTCADNKITKKLIYWTVFFALLGSARTKAARKMLMKLTPVETRMPHLIICKTNYNYFPWLKLFPPLLSSFAAILFFQLIYLNGDWGFKRTFFARSTCQVLDTEIENNIPYLKSILK